MEDHGRSIFTYPAHTSDVHRDNAAKWENMIEHPVFGHCTAFQSVFSHNRLGPFWHGSVFATTRSCVYGIGPIFSVSSSGNPS